MDAFPRLLTTFLDSPEFMTQVTPMTTMTSTRELLPPSSPR